MKHRVCVFSSSSSTLAPEFYEDARILGELIGRNNMDLVYGGSKVGTMFEIAKAVKQNGGKLIGVMPEKLYNFGVHFDECDEFYLTKDMRTRKSKLDEASDSIIAMAGGFGTLDEVSEMLVLKQLGYNNKPIVFLNTNVYYNNLLKFYDDIVKNSFAKDTAENLYYVAQTPKDAINYLLSYDYTPVKLTMEDIYTRIPEGVTPKS